MSDKIVIDGKYQYRNGKTPRILCTDAKGDGSVLTLCEETKAMRVHKDSGIHSNGFDEWDLIPIPQPPEYEPFDDGDRDEVRGKWIKRKIGDTQSQINRFGPGTCQNMKWADLFHHWTYLDGRATGKVKQ